MTADNLSDSSSESDNDIRYDVDDDEWQDAEPDQERVEILSLFDDQKFLDIKSMLSYCKDKYSFDLLDVQKRLSKLNRVVLMYPGMLTFYRTRLLWTHQTCELYTFRSRQRKHTPRYFQ
jgi:hypothetical protein